MKTATPTSTKTMQTQIAENTGMRATAIDHQPPPPVFIMERRSPMSTPPRAPQRTSHAARGLVWQVGALLVVLGLVSAPGMATGATLVSKTSFVGLYDTADGWPTEVGNPSVHAPVAEPTLAMGRAQLDGGTIPELQLGAETSLGQFFNPLQGPTDIHNAEQSLASVFTPPAGYTVTQPQLLRAQSAYTTPSGTVLLDRYILVALVTNFSIRESWLGITTTKFDGDLEAGYCLAWIHVNTPSAPYFADTPRLGQNSEGLLIAVDRHDFTSSSFQGAEVWVLPKPTLFNDPTQASCPAFSAPPGWVGFQNADGTPAFALVPAQSAVNSPVTYLINALYPQTTPATQLTLWSVNLTNVMAPTFARSIIPTPPYSLPPDAQQPGTTTRIGVRAWGARLANAVYQSAGLWTVQVVGCTPSGDTAQRSCLKWYLVDTRTATVTQQGLVDYVGAYVFAPWLAVDTQSNVVLVYNASGPNRYVSIDYIGRQATTAPNTLQGPAAQLPGGGGKAVTNAPRPGIP
jgi:hypothetical protein